MIIYYLEECLYHHVAVMIFFSIQQLWETAQCYRLSYHIFLTKNLRLKKSPCQPHSLGCKTKPRTLLSSLSCSSLCECCCHFVNVSVWYLLYQKMLTQVLSWRIIHVEPIASHIISLKPLPQMMILLPYLIMSQVWCGIF